LTKKRSRKAQNLNLLLQKVETKQMLPVTEQANQNPVNRRAEVSLAVVRKEEIDKILV
jgi:hypothetical protein